MSCYGVECFTHVITAIIRYGKSSFRFHNRIIGPGLWLFYFSMPSHMITGYRDPPGKRIQTYFIGSLIAFPEKHLHADFAGKRLITGVHSRVSRKAVS